MRLVCGVGVNDSSQGESKGPYYFSWKNMIERCYRDEFHKRQPTYKGCSVCDDWLTFSSFKGWMIDKSWQGMQLDKDLLDFSNTVYSPDNCIFIPHKMNSLLLDCGATRGELPVGVYNVKGNLKRPYRARVHGFDGMLHLGYFATPEQAHNAWKTGKALQVIQAVKWWGDEPSVSHTYNEQAALNLNAFVSNELGFKKELV